MYLPTGAMIKLMDLVQCNSNGGDSGGCISIYLY